jgi:hypothetical protein
MTSEQREAIRDLERALAYAARQGIVIYAEGQWLAARSWADLVEEQKNPDAKTAAPIMLKDSGAYRSTEPELMDRWKAVDIDKAAEETLPVQITDSAECTKEVQKKESAALQLKKRR